MPVIRHKLAVPDRCGEPRPSPRWAIAPVDIRTDARALADLIEACGGAAEAGPPKLSVAGLRAELAGRNGRTAVAFLAQEADGVERGPAGFVLVIQATGEFGRRFSIGSLLVHPRVRRQGVGSALVDRAVAHVRGRGGESCHVETLGQWQAAVAFWLRTADRYRQEHPRFCSRQG